jgi:pimeloyl-ACP methyl ester carboxylesterase
LVPHRENTTRARNPLLVGHSLGGLVVRLYAARHPDQVAAAVLVDPTPGGLPSTALAGSTGAAASLWAAMQTGLAADLNAQHYLIAANTGHHVHLDDPGLVVRVIREQLMKLGTRAR